MRLSRKPQPELSPPGETLADQARRMYLALLDATIAELTPEIAGVMHCVGKSILDLERDQATAKRRLGAKAELEQAAKMQPAIVKAGEKAKLAVAEDISTCGELHKKISESRQRKQAAVDQHESLLREQAQLESQARSTLFATCDRGIARIIKIQIDRRNGWVERLMTQYRCPQTDARVMDAIAPINAEIHRLEELRLDPLGGLFVSGVKPDDTPGIVRSGPEYPTQFAKPQDALLKV